MPRNDGVSSSISTGAAPLRPSDNLPSAKPPASGTHRCSRCPANFKRVEHLKRHQLGHGDQRRFACPICSKKFTRSDILNRHVLVHRVQEPREPTIKRACFECARVRERCTRAIPCQRCHSKSIRCVYPSERPKSHVASSNSLVNGPGDSGLEADPLSHDSGEKNPGSQTWPKEISSDCQAVTQTRQILSSATSHPTWPSFSGPVDVMDAGKSGSENLSSLQWISTAVSQERETLDCVNSRTALDAHQSSDTTDIRDANQPSQEVAASISPSSFPYGNINCSIQTINSTPLIESALNPSTQINPAALGYSPEGYDVSFEFPLNWLPANESLDLDYSSIPRFGFNSPDFFEEPANSQMLQDSTMTGLTNDMRQPDSSGAGTKMSSNYGADSQPINYNQDIHMNETSHIDQMADHAGVGNGGNWRPHDERSDISTPISTSSPPVTISTVTQDLKKPSLTLSTKGGFYSTSTNGARMPCTTRAKKPSVIIFGATALTVVSHDMAEFEDDVMDITFPSLSHVSYSFLPSELCYDRIQPETYEHISTQFRQFCLDCGGIYPSYSSAEFPSIEHLNFFIKLYFQHFDPIFPIYHRQSADLNDNWILALAICAVGCQYTETIELSRCVVPMHEFLRRGIAMQIHVTELTRLELSLIQAMILNQITMLYYGPRKLSQLGSAINGTLIEIVHSMSLLAPTQPLHERQKSNGLSLEERWKQWVLGETKCRLGYAIWLIDNMAMYHYGRRPLLSLETAQAGLPDDRLWEARNSTEWHERVAGRDPNPSLPSAVADIFRNKTVKPDLGEFSRLILLHGVYYEVLRVNEYLNRPLSAWIPSAQKVHLEPDAGTSSHGPGSEHQKTLTRWRNAALDCVDVLHWDANGTIAQLAGEEHSTVFHLHFSRVVLLTPYEKIRTLTLSIASISKQQPYGRTPTREQALDAEREVLAWVRRDEHKARLAMIHCGCLFWHVRRYSRKVFYEPVSVLLATLALWAYSCYVSREKQADHQETVSRSQNCNSGDRNLGDIDIQAQSAGSDMVANASPESSSTTSLSTITTVAEAAAAMSESSYPIPTSIQLDRPCDDEMVQLFVRSGRPSAIRAYITGVGDILGPKGPARILAEGGKILCAVSAAWGRTSEYVALLAALEQVMIEREGESA